ncbi:uncharacterized protein LOC119678508 [Teleopsis dalmanni]|uniref:uncharacterized protein LOC119678508 n=1 Tax=Teleopsis dalmanni TaxID=139649 RepID=UPI0018CDF7B2|nr:uncharacterized protein LOC119678508 [Teleopsis dalmanni]
MSSNTCENWKDLSSKQRLTFIQNPANLTDCNFIVGKAPGEIRHFPCHKKVLSQFSEIFKSMFAGRYMESKEASKIILNDIQPNAFQHFVNYIYFDILLDSISLGDLMELAYLSEKYEFSGLSDKTQDLLKTKGKTPVSILEFARILETPLVKNYNEIIDAIKLRLEKNELMRSSQIYDMASPKFLLLMDKLHKDIPTLDHFSMVENYVEKNFMPKKRNASEKQICGIDFLNGSEKMIIERLLLIIEPENMTPKKFCDGPLNSSFISAQTKLDILTKIAHKYVANIPEITLSKDPKCSLPKNRKPSMYDYSTSPDDVPI